MTTVNPKWENIIADIIAHNLGLDCGTEDSPLSITATSDNFVYIYNQNFKLPNTPGLKIEIGFGQSKIISNKSYIDGNGESEIQEISSLDEFVINIMSQNSDARLKKHFVASALTSTYAQQKQEEFGFKINRIPSTFLNLSTAEGGSMYNRFQITISAFVWYKTEVTPEYYETFNAGVYDEPALEADTPLFTIDNTENPEGI